MSGRLTTHVLDTARGCPAAGVRLSLYRIDGGAPAALLRETVTNADGRCDAPLLEGETFVRGRYELVFQAGPYFAAQSSAAPAPPFLDDIVIRFGVADASTHYHVPLLVSPYGYTTYRGS